MKLFGEWCSYRMSLQGVPDEIIRCDLNSIGDFSKADLCFSMCRFIREVKKLDGSDYPPNTLRELVIMIQMFLHENNIMWKLLDNGSFSTLRNVVDNTMKE